MILLLLLLVILNEVRQWIWKVTEEIGGSGGIARHILERRYQTGVLTFTSEPLCSLGKRRGLRTSVKAVAMSNFCICGESNLARPIRSLVTMPTDLSPASPLNKSIIGDTKVAQLEET